MAGFLRRRTKPLVTAVSGRLSQVISATAVAAFLLVGYGGLVDAQSSNESESFVNEVVARQIDNAVPDVVLRLTPVTDDGAELGEAGADGNEGNPANDLSDGSGEPTPESVAELVDATSAVRLQLLELSGVAWVTSDLTLEPPQILVSFDAETGDRPLSAVEDIAEAFSIGGSANTGENVKVEVAGQAVVDKNLRLRITVGLVIVALLVAVLTAALVAVIEPWRRAALVGAVTLVAIWLATVLGGQTAGSFDGSLASTALPATLASSVAAVVVAGRLVLWFRAPKGMEQADMIRQAVREIGTDFLVVGAGFAVVSFFLELVGPGRSVASVGLVGVIVASAVVFSLLTPILAALSPVQTRQSGLEHEGGERIDTPGGDHGLAEAVAAAERTLEVGEASVGDATGEWSDFMLAASGSSDKAASMPQPTLVPAQLRVANGRQFPLGVMFGFVVFLLILVTFSVRATSNDRLLDSAIIDPGGTEWVGQLASSGDATSSILAEFPAGTDQQAKQAWLEQVSELDGVARVDTTRSRHIEGEGQELNAAAGQSGEADAHDEAPLYALIVPEIPARSADALRLLSSVESLNVLAGAELSGTPVTALQANQRDRSDTWVMAWAFALFGGVTTLVLSGDLGRSGASFVLRLLGAATTIGLYQILGSQPSGGEIQVVLLVQAVGASVFEAILVRGVARNVDAADSGLDTENVFESIGTLPSVDDAVAEVLHSEAFPAAAALALTAVASIGLVFVDIGIVGRLGLVMLVVAVVEVVVLSWLLRPVTVIGDGHQHALNITTRLMAIVQSVDDEGGDGSYGGPWAGVVNDLLQTEFSFQVQPRAAQLDDLYLLGTPLYQQATEHHNQLVEAGFRIAGQPPRLVEARVVKIEEQANLVVTVDHPLRQLIGPDGAVAGVRRAERRSVMLWLAAMSDGTYRMADSVELATVELGQSGAASGGALVIDDRATGQNPIASPIPPTAATSGALSERS